MSLRYSLVEHKGFDYTELSDAPFKFKFHLKMIMIQMGLYTAIELRLPKVVTLTEQNPPLKCCQPLELLTQ